MARDFDGSTQAGSSTTVPSTATQFWAMACWAWADSNSGEQVVVSNGKDDGAAGDGWAIEIESSAWKVLLSGIARSGSGGSVTTGVWTHLLIHRTTGNTLLWVNGTNTVAVGGTPNAPSTIFAVGAQGQTAGPTFFRWFDGKVSHVAVWDGLGSALATGDIAALAAGCDPRRVRPDALKGYVPLWGASSPEQDLIAGRSLTLTAAPAQANGPPVEPATRYLWAPPEANVTPAATDDLGWLSLPRYEYAGTY